MGLCLLSCCIKAQTVTPVVYSNQGGYNVASGGSISWTIGEPVSETYTTSTNKTTMGFHQPELGVATLIKEQGDQADVLVFPNPVSDVLTISFKDLNTGSYHLELHDDLGKMIYKNDVEIKDDNKMVQLTMQPFSSGNYYLRIGNSTFNKTVKLNKTN